MHGARLNQPDSQAMLKAGIEAVGKRQGDDALDVLTRAHQLDPNNSVIRYWLGNAYRLCQRPERAEAMFRQLLDEAPGNEAAGFALAFLLRENGRRRLAAEVLVNLSAFHRDDLQTLLRITGFLRDSNQFEAAIDVLLMALILDRSSADLHFKLARLYQAVGKFPDAVEQFRATLELNPDIGGAWLSLAQLQRFSDPASADFIRITRASKLRLSTETAMCLAFAQAKALDDLGQWDQAWPAYERGNQLRRVEQPFDASEWQKRVEANLKDSLQPATTVLPGRRRPIFIVGMLRSGTTLLEQLLSRHDSVHGRGELNFLAHMTKGYKPEAPFPKAQMQEMARELYTQMRQDGPEEHYYIDKNPLNFRFLGFLLRIMPEALILHVRRDGRDSCLSCFFQLFQHPDAAFSNALDDLRLYYQGYLDIMQHWQYLLPGRIHEVSYERLVTHPQEELASVQSYLGLDVKDLIEMEANRAGVIRTASTWQARQSLHQRSMGRWENYYAMAPEFFDAISVMDGDHPST